MVARLAELDLLCPPFALPLPLAARALPRLRVDAVGFDRDDALVEPLDVLLAFGAEPLADPLPALLRGLLEVDLLFAILILFFVGNSPP